MAVVLRLARCGKKNAPYYHIVAACERKPRDGNFLELLGSYNPRSKEKNLQIARDRVDHWLKNGARPSATVSKLLARSAQ